MSKGVINTNSESCPSRMNYYLRIPLEYIEHVPFVQLKEDTIRDISLSRLSEIDSELKDYGITLFLNQLKCIESYKVRFPCIEKLQPGEYVVFGYVVLDNIFGLSTLINSIVNKDQITFQLNIIYISNYSRIMESTPVICKLNNEGEKDLIIRYQFSKLEHFNGKWWIETYEAKDNIDYPDDPIYQANKIILLEREELEEAPSTTMIDLHIPRIPFPSIFARVYKAFDTKDNEALIECSSEYGNLIANFQKLEKENLELRNKILLLERENRDKKKFLEQVKDDIILQLQSWKI
jgi:hypothetical protein